MTASYVTIIVVQRMPYFQKRNIMKRLDSDKNIESKTSGSGLWVNRGDKQQWLEKVLSGLPSGPIIVTGPSGGGKSTLIQKCLGNRNKQTWYIDLREHPIQSGTDFIYTVIEEFGYLLPPSELLARSVLNFGGAGRSRVDPIESSKALNLFIEVLEKLQRDRESSPDGDKEQQIRPVLCIDHIDFTLSHRRNKKEFLNDENVLNFINWCLFLTDQRLCHVVFTMSMEAASELDLHKGLRLRREIMFVDYPRTSRLVSFLEGPVNAQLQVKGSEPLRDWEIERIVQTAGGHLKDLDVVVASIFNDRSWQLVLERLVADSIDFVELHLENIWNQAEVAKLNVKTSDISPFLNTDSPAYWYAKYERFWRIIDTFAARKYVSKRQLLHTVMEMHSEELSTYVDEEILMSLNFKMMTRNENIKRDTVKGIISQPFEGRHMAVTSPRLRVAFQILSSSPDSSLKAQRKIAQDMIVHYQLIEKEKLLEKKYNELKSERDFLQRELVSAIQHNPIYDEYNTIKAQRNVLHVQCEATKLQLAETREMLGYQKYPPYKHESFVAPPSPPSPAKAKEDSKASTATAAMEIRQFSM